MQLQQAADERLPKTEILAMWLVVAIAVGMVFWSKLDDAMVSTDNVMRLVEVRALLNGAPWFDPHEARFAPPLGYDTHWSRLIDAGLAGLIVSFRQVVAPDLAERLTRCIWPLLMAGPAVAAVVSHPCGSLLTFRIQSITPRRWPPKSALAAVQPGAGSCREARAQHPRVKFY